MKGPGDFEYEILDADPRRIKRLKLWPNVTNAALSPAPAGSRAKPTRPGPRPSGLRIGRDLYPAGADRSRRYRRSSLVEESPDKRDGGLRISSMIQCPEIRNDAFLNVARRKAHDRRHGGAEPSFAAERQNRHAKLPCGHEDLVVGGVLIEGRELREPGMRRRAARRASRNVCAPSR